MPKFVSSLVHCLGMALHGVGIVSAEKALTLKIFEGLGLSFTHFGEGEQGQHSEAKIEGGTTLMVDTVDVMKKSNPDFQCLSRKITFF